MSNNYPKTVAARKALRTRIRNEAMAEAERTAERRGRSITCAEYDDHAPGGCKSDGSNCICECHDPTGRSDA